MELVDQGYRLAKESNACTSVPRLANGPRRSRFPISDTMKAAWPAKNFVSLKLTHTKEEEQVISTTVSPLRQRAIGIFRPLRSYWHFDHSIRYI